MGKCRHVRYLWQQLALRRVFSEQVNDCGKFNYGCPLTSTDLIHTSQRSSCLALTTCSVMLSALPSLLVVHVGSVKHPYAFFFSNEKQSIAANLCHLIKVSYYHVWDENRLKLRSPCTNAKFSYLDSHAQ